MNNRDDASARCCAECEEEGGVSLKACKACMSVKYCNAICQRKHWAKHKTACKLRATELRYEAMNKDPPPKEDCPFCFLRMPVKLICCVSLPPATIMSVPINDFAKANEELARMDMEGYYTCCGKSICAGCVHSCRESGNDGKCPFCNAGGKSDEERLGEVMKRVAANDAASIYVLAGSYYQGLYGLQRDRAKAIELYTRAAELGYSKAHGSLGKIYHDGGALKKAKLRPQLWQDTKWQGTTLDAWIMNQDILSELLSIWG